MTEYKLVVVGGKYHYKSLISCCFSLDSDVLSSLFLLQRVAWENLL